MNLYGCTGNVSSCTTGVCGGDPGAEECPVGTLCDFTGRKCVELCGACGKECEYGGYGYTGPVKTIPETISVVYNFLFYGSLILSLFYFASGLYELMSSEGDPRKKQGAVDKLVRTFFGTMFTLSSIVTLRLIINSLLASGSL
jgi:hypothetical protein